MVSGPAGAGLAVSQLSIFSDAFIVFFKDVWVIIRLVLILYLCFLHINIELSSKSLVRYQGYGEEKGRISDICSPRSSHRLLGDPDCSPLMVCPRQFTAGLNLVQMISGLYMTLKW